MSIDNKNEHERLYQLIEAVRLQSIGQTDRLAEYMRGQNKKIEELEKLILDNWHRLMENTSRLNETIENTERLGHVVEMAADETKTAIIQRLEEIIRINSMSVKSMGLPEINININGGKSDGK